MRNMPFGIKIFDFIILTTIFFLYNDILWSQEEYCRDHKYTLNISNKFEPCTNHTILNVKSNSDLCTNH